MGKIKRRAIIVIPIIAIMAVIVVAGILFYWLCIWPWIQPPVVVKNGFSDELVEMIYEANELAIPQNAEFIYGVYDSPLAQDAGLMITFKVSDSDFLNMFSSTWEEAKPGTYSSRNFAKDKDGQICDFTSNGAKFLGTNVWVQYSYPDDKGFITCVAYLRRTKIIK